VFSATTRNDKIMYVLLMTTIVLGLGNHSARQPDRAPARLPADRHAVVPVDLLPPPGHRAHPQGAHRLPLHVLAAWALIAFWPFSRLVHVFSAPLGYLTRPYTVYRSRDTQLGSRAPRRGWERVQ